MLQCSLGTFWGALNKTAQRHLKELIQKYHPSFLIVMETHGFYSRTTKFWNKVGYSKVEIVEARGQAGGYGCCNKMGVM